MYGSYAASSGEGSYLTGSSVTVNAGSRDGYTFSGWTVSEGGVSLSNSSTATFTIPANNVVLSATWTPIPSNGDGSNGSSPSPSPSEPEPSIPTPSSPSYTSNVNTDYVFTIGGIMLLAVLLVIVVLVIVVIVAVVLLLRKRSKT